MLETPDARGRLVPLLSFFSLRAADIADLDALPPLDALLPPDDLPLVEHGPHCHSACCRGHLKRVVQFWSNQFATLAGPRTDFNSHAGQRTYKMHKLPARQYLAPAR